jgi:hypothetical protein
MMIVVFGLGRSGEDQGVCQLPHILLNLVPKKMNESGHSHRKAAFLQVSWRIYWKRVIKSKTRRRAISLVKFRLYQMIFSLKSYANQSHQFQILFID